MKISKIDRYTSVARIEQNKANTQPINDYRFKEIFDFREIDNFDNKEDILAGVYGTEYLLTVLARLLEEVVTHGCQVMISKALAINDYIIEAYFVSSYKKTQSPRIVLPLPLNEVLIPVMDPAKIYPQNFLKNLIDNQIIQLLNGRITTSALLKQIVLLSHEFGHYLSFLRSSHTQELLQATQYLYQNNATPMDSRYISAILCEEVAAWRLAEEKVEKYFEQGIPRLFFQVRDIGLASYSKKLSLAKADVAVFTKLSLLGVDLAKL